MDCIEADTMEGRLYVPLFIYEIVILKKNVAMGTLLFNTTHYVMITYVSFIHTSDT